MEGERRAYQASRLRLSEFVKPQIGAKLFAAAMISLNTIRRRILRKRALHMNRDGACADCRAVRRSRNRRNHSRIALRKIFVADMQRGPIGPLCMSAIQLLWLGFTPPRRPEIAPPLAHAFRALLLPPMPMAP